MAVTSKLSQVVALLIGRLEGELEARIQSEALSMLDKFVNKCPVREELVKIIKVRNSLLNVINSFEKTTNKFKSIADSLKVPVIAAKVLIKLLENNPIPSAIIVHPGGVGVTLGKITTLSGKLRVGNKLLETLEDDIVAITGLVDGVTPSLEAVKSILNTVDIKIQVCVKEIKDPDELNDLINSTQPAENTGSEGTPNENYRYTGKNGRNYTLVIIEDKSEETTVPRRRAIAKDAIGVVVLRGEASFSSDTQVLLDEIKFRIDNQLP